MSDPFVGEIRIFAGNFAPRSWALCDGQLLAINQNDALFSLLGTTYGGDGRTTFALPDMRGRVNLKYGNAAPGLSSYRLGEKGGTENETITTNTMASHTHTLLGSDGDAAANTAENNVLANTATFNLYGNTGNFSQLKSSAIANSGGGQSHTNMMPFLCINHIICLYGVYPSRN